MMNTGSFSPIRVKKPSAVFSPVKTAKLLFPQVGEIKEEDKNETEEDLSQIDLLDGGKSKVLGILALTKENLKRLDLKNQVRTLTALAFWLEGLKGNSQLTICGCRDEGSRTQ